VVNFRQIFRSMIPEPPAGGGLTGRPYLEPVPPSSADTGVTFLAKQKLDIPEVQVSIW
jgi:hypothetical protein